MASYDFSTAIGFPQEAIEYLITWRCYQDACPECQSLRDYPFVFEGALPQLLIHPHWGPVWDVVNDVSLTHPNCRCTLEVYVRVDWAKIPEFYELQTVLQQYNISFVGFQKEVYDVSQLAEVKNKVESLRVETAHATGALREFEYVTYRVVSLLNKMGLPPEVDACITRIQHLILSARLLHSSIILLQSTTPYGWILAGLTLVSAGISLGAEYEVTRPQY